MQLTIDIGNTNVTCAIFRDARIMKRWRISTGDCADEAAISKSLVAGLGRRNVLDGISCVSVVPRLDPLFRRACRNAFGIDPFFATWKTIPMRIRGYDRRQLGADRLVAAFAAYQRYRRPVIVIDAGTAITIDLVNGRGEFAGGVIVPGLAIAAASLHSMTAKLPLVSLRPARHAIGRNTREAINSGIVYGFAGLIDNLVRKISRESRVRPIVVATGGDADLLMHSCTTIDRAHPDLVLEGLTKFIRMTSGISHR